MGFGSFLGTIGKIGAGVAAPFTGGASLAAIPAIDAIGAGLSGTADSMTNNRSQRAKIEAEKLKLGQTQENNYFNTLLQKDQQQGANANTAFRRLLQTSYLSDPAAHIKTPGVAGQYSRPISGPAEGAVAAAQDPTMQAALTSRANYSYDPLGGQVPTRTLDFSALDKTGKSSIWEKLLGIGGAAASAYGAANGNRD